MEDFTFALLLKIQFVELLVCNFFLNKHNKKWEVLSSDGFTRYSHLMGS